MKNGLFAAIILTCCAVVWAAETPAPAQPAPAQPAAATPAAAPAQPTPAPAQPTPAPAQPAPAQPVVEAAPAVAQPAVVQFPYMAEVIGTEVYVRSGPGTAYYHCGKLNTPQRVTVAAAEANNWFKILPPPGSFSWISKKYVTVDPAQPTKGTVTDDVVRVWAGSDFVEPMRSSSLQTKLNKGASVEIVGNPAGEGDYYKIIPPAGAFLYVSGESLKPILPEVKKEEPKKEEPAKAPQTEVKEGEAKLTDVTTEIKPEEAVEPKKEEPKPVVPARPAMEQTYLKQCYDLSAKLDEEIKKPVPDQKYDEYKKVLEPMLADPNEAGIAAQYAKYLSDRITRYELAISAGDQMKQQDQKMAEIRKQIDEARKAQLEKIAKQYEQYVMTGILKQSYVYSGNTAQKRFLLTNDQGRVIAYVVPSEAGVAAKAESLFNKKVGIMGRFVNSPKELVSLITATNIEEVQQ